LISRDIFVEKYEYDFSEDKWDHSHSGLGIVLPEALAVELMMMEGSSSQENSCESGKEELNRILFL
jgi:hypothetical protein